MTLYHDIMQASASDVKLFHRLIKAQRTTSTASTGQLVINGLLVMDQDELMDAWTRHFSKLATPGPNPAYDSAYQRLVSEDLMVIETLCSNPHSTPEPITDCEIIKAVSKLHPGKAADVHQLSAEHLKYSLSAVLPRLRTLLNTILESGHLPVLLQDSYMSYRSTRRAETLSSATATAGSPSPPSSANYWNTYC